MHFIDRDAIILLKAIAYINNSNRKANGEAVRSEQITKHKNDIFRIVSTYTGEDRIEVPETSPIAYWIYGHSHRNIDKQIGNTQCVSNQLGYVFHNEHLSFAPGRVIDI